ncbi:concanavalin A-like lectin/glucanase domain-containing protein [Hypoxylon cercidicola]|nr:concanavalin A-like lectin/glucanase domain-containing protein [Hypoxylon cercidicola]
MKAASSILAVLLAAFGAVASPTSTIEKRDTQISCAAFGSLATGGYTIYHNNWGAGQASSGSQCTSFKSLSGNSVAWSTSWTWEGGPGQVKSYSNVALEKVNKQLSAVKSIPSTWSWTYTGSNRVSDVAYDLWLSPTSGGTNTYEIMIWLEAAGGAGPISATGSPIASPTLAGSSWNLYLGKNGDVNVFSFVTKKTINNFKGNLVEFFNYLTKNQGVAASNYITSLQAGTEPFSGENAVFTTSAYSISVS